jgi:hypothetical protein
MRRRRGSALVEFAVAFAALTPLVAGFVQHGYAIWLRGDLEAAVREGARHGATLARGAAAEGEIRMLVLRHAGAPGLTPEHVRVAVGSEVSVEIRGYRLPTVFGGVAFDGAPRASYSYLVRE